MEKFESQQEQFPISEAFNRLRQVADILRDMGMGVIDRLITEDNLASGLPFPIVKDGLDGMRAEYSRRRGLKIWFTNGFEDANNPRRQEIEQRLKEAGL